MWTNHPMRSLVTCTAALLAGLLLVAAPSATAQGPVESLAEAWARSPHAQADSESFTHWDSEGAVPVGCATCHAGAGFRDFVGAGGRRAGVVDQPAPIHSVIGCDTCHNDAADALASVTFPSGATVDGIGPSTKCMVCHQGRESKQSVDNAVGQMDEDTVSADLAFINVHYRAAAASLFGGMAHGAYEYDGKEYVGRFQHVPSVDTCTGCHNPHGLEVVVDRCAGCHQTETPTAIRMNPTDADGDGDVTEGVAGEIATMNEALLAAIAAYASSVSGTPIAYSDAAYPYFFADDGDGVASADEAVFPNRYASWTPRLLKAAYNYQFVAKDPGIYAHNPRYAMQIIYDSIESLSTEAAIDLDGMVRP